eukprot:357615-Chlamydomonas_euryale.AAC.2
MVAACRAARRLACHQHMPQWRISTLQDVIACCATVAVMTATVCVVLQLWTAQPPLAEWIRRGQPAHTPPQRPPGVCVWYYNSGRLSLR